MIKAFNNAITPEQTRRAVCELCARQDFEALADLPGHQPLHVLTRQLHGMAFDGADLPNFAELQVYEMQHALTLIRVCSTALREIERAAHEGLKSLQGFAQHELDQINALKFEFIDLEAV